MSTPEPRDLLWIFPPPPAPGALRERALAGAREAASKAIRPSRADRIWFSHGWRMAWAGGIAALVLIEAFSANAARSTGRPRSPSAGTVRESAVAAEALGLPARGWVGDRVATNRETLLGAEEPL